MSDSSALRVAVVGGGLAGITAALRCADAGADVCLLESRPRLGGLTYSFRRGALEVDNGQHVFLRCCTEYLALLDRLGVREHVYLQPALSLEVRRPGSVKSSWLRRDHLPAPLHLTRALTTYSALRPVDRARVLRGAAALRRLNRAEPAADDQSFGSWLRARGQNESTMLALWDLLTVATLNAHCEDVSLAQAAMIFQVGLFADADAGDVGYSTVPLQHLHGDAAGRSLHDAGAAVHTSAKVTALARGRQGWVVSARGAAPRSVDAVVLAVPPAATETLLPPEATTLAPGWSAALGSSPIVNVHVLFDRPVLRSPFLAGVGSTVQWIFDRSAQSGLAPGRYLALSLSAATDHIDEPVATLRARILPALAELVPAVRSAAVEDFFVTRERDATFFPRPGSGALRLDARTRVPGLAVAGAWTRTGWPATMEGAVRSGRAAAEVVLDTAVSRKKGLRAA